jgi:hypothetical protein
LSKESTKAALHKYYAKDAKKTDRAMNGSKRKNERPEFELTAKPCWKWFDLHKFSMSIVESKAVFNAEAGRYVDGQAESGFPDAVGCTPTGIGAFVEFKAPGKRASIRPGQYMFLMEKISKGCFAVCTDSVDYLAKAWGQFLHLRAMDPILAINFLRRELPVPPILRQSDDGAGELPF